MRMYEVGGCVRDELLGTPSKDIDFAVVMEDDIPWMKSSGWYDDPPYDRMVASLESQGYQIFRDDKGKIVGSEFFTARGKFPKWHPKYAGKAADFVLARKESGYSDGRHPDKVESGTLEDDLARRDFTMNAIARSEQGVIIDPHGGALDIERKIIRAVGDPLERLLEDPLRALRALRFSVTKRFNLDKNLRWAMVEPLVVEGVAEHVSDERIADELGKMFRHDTVLSLLTLNAFPSLMSAAFSGKVSLDATMKQKGRG